MHHISNEYDLLIWSCRKLYRKGRISIFPLLWMSSIIHIILSCSFFAFCINVCQISFSEDVLGILLTAIHRGTTANLWFFLPLPSTYCRIVSLATSMAQIAALFNIFIELFAGSVCLHVYGDTCRSLHATFLPDNRKVYFVDDANTIFKRGIRLIISNYS